MEKTCSKCTSPMLFKQGTKKETGKPWSGYFCQNQACKNVEWLNSRSKAEKPHSGANNASGNEQIMDALRKIYAKLDAIEKFLIKPMSEEQSYPREGEVDVRELPY